jgi:chromatin remodeling complex protein RSC6
MASQQKNSRKSTKTQSASNVTESTSSVVSTPVSAPVVPTPSPAPVLKEVVAPVVKEVVAPVSATPVGTESVVEVQEVNHFENLNSKLKQAQSLLRDLTSELSQLQKEVERLKKSVKKAPSKSRKSVKSEGASETGTVTNRSGINKEVNVSEELAKFLGVSADTKVSRIQVSRAVSEYITKHNLQNPSNRRNIVLDETLSKLLNPPSDVTLSYFNLQTYLKPHYRT